MILKMLIVVLAHLVALATSDGHMKTARIDNFGEPVVLHCEETTSLRFAYWLLPNLKKLTSSSSDGSMIVYANKTLYIPAVEEENTGDYLCVMKRTDTMEDAFFKTYVYLYVPTLWEIYRMNVIIGGAAAGAFLVIAILFCCVCNNRWEDKQRHRDQVADSDFDSYQGKPIDANGGVEMTNQKDQSNAAYASDVPDPNFTAASQGAYPSNTGNRTIINVAVNDYEQRAQGVTAM